MAGMEISGFQSTGHITNRGQPMNFHITVVEGIVAEKEGRSIFFMLFV